MRYRLSSPKATFPKYTLQFAILWLVVALTGQAQTFVFHLKNGDRITGTVSSENAELVTVATPFAGSISLPLAQIQQRERIQEQPPPAPPETAQAKPPPPAPAPPSQAKPPPKPPATDKPPAPEVEKVSLFKQFLSKWNGTAQVGVNLGFSTRDHQAFTGRFKGVYAPIKDFRNDVDYLASYGTTDGVLSENRMEGSWKVEYDVSKNKRFLIYNSARAGYNEIQKIDLRYDIGPGLGYKVLISTNYVLKTELGANYQEQRFSTGDVRQKTSLRLGEDFTWQVNKKMKFDQKFEFFPQFASESDYHLRAEVNLNYLLLDNLTLTLSVIDLYDTTRAAGADKNDLQLRSLIGVRF